MNDPVVELKIPARPEFVGLVRLLVATLAASRRELAEDRVDDLRLAVSEATTNAVESYRKPAADHWVTVRWQDRSDRLELWISDRGRGFDPERLPAHPPVTDAERLNFERGLGVPLIKTMVDEALFESNDEGTVVRMVMYCGPKEDPDLGF